MNYFGLHLGLALPNLWVQAAEEARGWKYISHMLFIAISPRQCPARDMGSECWWIGCTKGAGFGLT